MKLEIEKNILHLIKDVYIKFRTDIIHKEVEMTVFP